MERQRAERAAERAERGDRGDRGDRGERGDRRSDSRGDAWLFTSWVFVETTIRSLKVSLNF